MRKLCEFIAALALLLIVTGCGGGGGGGDDDFPLNGSWGGTIEDPNGSLGVITLTISDSEISGTTPAGPFSGTITHEQLSVWGFVLSDGKEGGFLHDLSFSHAVFVDEDFNFGVVQKGASGPSTYSAPDLVGSFDGPFVTMDANFFLATTGSASATMLLDATFSGTSSAGDNFDGELGAFDADFGRWNGVGNPNINSTSINSTVNETGQIVLFLTNDKNFAGSYACFPNIAAFPAGCAFSMWDRL